MILAVFEEIQEAIMVRNAGVRRIVSFLEQEREKRGLAGNELARASGLDSGTVSRIFSGQTVPSLASIEALATALGYSLETVLLSCLPAVDAEEHLLLDMWRRLPAEQRSWLMKTVEALLDTPPASAPD